jgi:hypothetical protein
MSLAEATLEAAASVAEPPARSELAENRKTEAVIFSMRPRTLGDLEVVLGAAVKRGRSVGTTVRPSIRRAPLVAGGPA